MKVTVFLDGRPGHEKQSLAIIMALKEFVEVEVNQITLNPKSALQRIIDSFLLIIRPDGGCEFELLDTDLVIGSGTATHAPLLASKKRYAIPAVTCMGPNPIFRRKFDLCCVPRHDRIGEEKNIFFTDGPPVLPVPQLPRQSNGGLILIGGEDRRSHYWSNAEISSYVESVVKEQPDIDWRVSSSPRTPAACVALMRQLEKEMANVTFFNFKDTPRGWVEEQYAWASTVWVTADSMSMIYESLTAGCNVGIFPVKWKTDNNKFQASIDYLLGKELIISYQENATNRPPHHLGTFNEAKRCAIEILQRFFERQTHE